MTHVRHLRNLPAAREAWIDYLLARLRAGEPVSPAQVDELERLLGDRVERIEAAPPPAEPEDEAPGLEGYHVEFELVLDVPSRWATPIAAERHAIKDRCLRVLAGMREDALAMYPQAQVRRARVDVTNQGG